MCHRLGGVERLAAADADHNIGPVLRRGTRDPLDLAGRALTAEVHHLRVAHVGKRGPDDVADRRIEQDERP
jgi:hypothetical protein